MYYIPSAIAHRRTSAFQGLEISMSHIFDAESFESYGLKLVVEDYNFRKQYIVEAKTGNSPIARIFEKTRGEFSFSFAGSKFAISYDELNKLIKNAEVRYYHQTSIHKLNSDKPILVSSLASN
jgi:hypothetical protein